MQCNAVVTKQKRSRQRLLLHAQVILARVDAIRRQVENGTEGMGSLRAAFIAADGLMQSYFPGFTDPALRIPAYRADCEMRLGKDIKTARSVWEAALKTPASRYTRPSFTMLALRQSLNVSSMRRTSLHRLQLHGSHVPYAVDDVVVSCIHRDAS